MRFSPDGQRIAFVDGLGLHPPVPVATVSEPDDTQVALSFGHDPCWTWPNEVLYRDHSSGEILRSRWPAWDIERTGNYANELTAGAGWYAYALASEHAVTIVGRGTLPDSFEPSLSQDGRWLARRRHSTGELMLLNLSDMGEYAVGPGTRARWSGSSVVWQWGGRIYGRTTPDQPTRDLTPPGRSASHPLIVWDGSALTVFAVIDDGELWAFDFFDSTQGWPIGKSAGSAFEWDSKVAA